ncbi:MAG: hypothetical protein QW447_03380 [Candidatus Bathyarchaeia archaeon]
MGGLKLVSFDVWDTLLSVRAFYRDIALELSKLLESQQSSKTSSWRVIEKSGPLEGRVDSAIPA